MSPPMCFLTPVRRALTLVKINHRYAKTFGEGYTSTGTRVRSAGRASAAAMTPSLSAHRGGSPVGFVDRMIRRGSRGIQNIVGMAPKHDEDVKGKSKVVIIGGGFAGRRCQSLLSSGFDVTLIDAKVHARTL